MADKLKEHDLKGIKVGVEQGDSRIDLALWREAENNRWKTLKPQDIPTLQPEQLTISENQEAKTPETIQEEPQTSKEKVVIANTVDSNQANNNNNSGSESSE